jgi:CelD/BcsL family acetyltransferase involved in cellulose biosynthesis
LTALAPPNWLEETTESAACPILALPDSVTALPERLPARMAHNLLFYGRRAAKLGRVDYCRADRDNLEEIWAAHSALHRARWRARGEDGVLANDAVLRAHRESLPRLLADDTLRLYALRIDRRIVATLYGLLDKPGPERRFYYYLAGFDPELAQLSPGTLLLGHAIEQAIVEGCRVFDFLAGREPYKYRWGAVDTQLRSHRLCHGGHAKARSATAVDRVPALPDSSAPQLHLGKDLASTPARPQRHVS